MQMGKFFSESNKSEHKLGLNCAKLRPAWDSYQLAFVGLAYTEAAYYA